ncbi:hypothetical protein SJI19_16800 [Acerihabitans sp. TG2]|uniref:hypothetical protein n=1 Tax=Acerihabitans sp. TG2 TaxID=3096008 RepID=UPI002B23ADD7|nr:hypothetical protein [Acerihabitans sp. TG2]MEA9392185.1 hypothetical protein [Acerihabitans sp. TG2]
MDAFDPVLLFNSDLSFEEDKLYVMDELSQIRASEENMRRCFSLRIASRIVSLVLMQGVITPDNNFINAMDALTKRFSTLFNAAYDFLKIGAATDDHLYVVQMMNNAIIDLMTNEIRLKAAGVEVIKGGLNEKDLGDFMRSILISQKLDFISFSPSGEVGFSHESPLLSSDQVRRTALMSAAIKFTGLGNIFDYFYREFNVIIRFLINEVMDVTERQLKAVAKMNTAVPVSFAMVADYYNNNVGLMCEVYKRVAKDDVIKLKGMSDIDKSVLLSHYQTEGMSFTHIGKHYRAASKQVTDHVEFIMDVYYSQYYEEV